MIVKVFNRNKAIEQSKIDYVNNKIIISISTPGDEFPDFCEENHSILDVLYLSFYDIEDKRELNPIAKDDEIFNDNYAEQIANFVNIWNKGDIEIWVHCDAGVSRSAGVGAALSKYFNNNDDEYFDNSGNYFPNNLCYRKTLKKLHEVLD